MSKIRNNFFHKTKIIVAFGCYALGLSKIIDWFIFLAKRDFSEYDFLEVKAEYVARFPARLQPLFSLHPEPATVICIVLFLIAAILFLQQKKTIYIILSLSAFFFAAWNIFSLM